MHTLIEVWNYSLSVYFFKDYFAATYYYEDFENAQTISTLNNELFGCMLDYNLVYSFENLYKAHKKARLGKRSNNEVIKFEMELSKNLVDLSNELESETYKLSSYYEFWVHDPKKRKIHALHYRDRIVQHVLCDEILVKLLDKKMIYDNAACRINKGTHFAIGRVNGFLLDFYKMNKTNGYILKCDIKKFFDNIDHNVLIEKLTKVIDDKKILKLIVNIINSYETSIGKGLPLGNQTSQWFAIYYLDGLDRLIKEKLHIKYYSRYMDDLVLIHHDKEYLKHCLTEMKKLVNSELKLEFNEKTQIFPISQGVDYLGFHFYLTENGKIIRRLRTQRKIKIKRKFKSIQNKYSKGMVDKKYIWQMINSYSAHLSHGHTYKLWCELLKRIRVGESEIENNWNGVSNSNI